MSDIIVKVESLIHTILEQLDAPGGQVYLTLKSRPTTAVGFKLNEETGALEAPRSKEGRRILWTGASEEEARRFTIYLRILDLVHEALVTNVLTTKRDIYYKAPDLFHCQNIVDSCIDDLAYSLGVSRRALNVEATARGLVLGYFWMTMKNGEEVFGGTHGDGMSVPDMRDICQVNISKVGWILVVEKEATFKTLVSTGFHMKYFTPGIILTAKGYPDLATRFFVKCLLTARQGSLPSEQPIPIHALVDFDPDGIAIMSTYKYGSVSLSHENAALALPQLHWLGVKSSDIPTVILTDQNVVDTTILRLSVRDRKKATDMLENSPILAENGSEKEWRREIQTMLMLNIKAEMQLFSKLEGGLQRFVAEKMSV